MRNRTRVALGATLGSAAAALWRFYNEPIDVVIEEVEPALEPNPDPTFPWHQFTGDYKIPEHWVAESIEYYEKPYIHPSVPGPTDSIRVPPPPPAKANIHDALPGLKAIVMAAAPAPKPDPWPTGKPDLKPKPEPQPKVKLVSSQDWPKNHVAFSAIPGVGRPLPEGGVLNSHWEAPPEEKAFREERAAWWDNFTRLNKKVRDVIGYRTLNDLTKEGGFEAVHDSLRVKLKAITEARVAATQLEAMIGSEPKHPSQQ